MVAQEYSTQNVVDFGSGNIFPQVRYQMVAQEYYILFATLICFLMKTTFGFFLEKDSFVVRLVVVAELVFLQVSILETS